MILTRRRGTSWETNEEKIVFPAGKRWQDYVLANRLEISCGEAPYLVSRYDATKAKYDTAEQGTVVTEFDEGLWGTLVDFMTVYSKEDISVTFKDGTEIHIV